jgi:hypothetical protein
MPDPTLFLISNSFNCEFNLQLASETFKDTPALGLQITERKILHASKKINNGLQDI